MRFLSLFSFFLLLISCVDQGNNPDFPNAPVQIELIPGQGAHTALQAIGAHSFVEAGVEGIIIYRINQNQFSAVERLCPYHPEDNCGILTPEEDITFTCVETCCGSSFLLNNGEVIDGPSPYNARLYKTAFDGFQLRIWN